MDHFLSSQNSGIDAIKTSFHFNMKSRKEALCYKTAVEFRLCTKRAAFFVRFILWQMVWGALACGLRSLHELVMERSQEFDKEERLLLCLSLLLQRYGQPFEQCVPECRDEIERACAFMEQHYAGRICLDQICRVPVITVAASVLILQEPFTWMTAAGTALTLAGLFLSESKPKKERAKDGTSA